jgi:hypothetical protein
MFDIYISLSEARFFSLSLDSPASMPSPICSRSSSFEILGCYP